MYSILKGLKSTQYGYFRNQDDAQRPEIDPRRHFEIQDGDFRFLENSPKWANTTQYGNFRNWDDAQRPEINSRRHFEIQDDNFRFLERALNGKIPSIMGISATGMKPRATNHTSQNWRILPNNVYFRNRDDAQRPQIDPKHHFEIQDGDFRFLENSPKWPLTSQYGYFRNRDDAQKPENDFKCHFEVQDGDLRFLENSLT